MKLEPIDPVDSLDTFTLPPPDVEADGDDGGGNGAVPEIVDPLTGELIEADNLDALIDLHERCKREAEKIYVARTLAAKALALATTGEAKTRRLVTATGRKIKIEMPSPTWDNARLKRLWASYPDIRDTYLRIEAIAPQLREVNKLRETTCQDGALVAFKTLLLGAEKPATGTPRVVVES